MTALWITLSVLGFLCLLFLFLIFPSLRRHPGRQQMDGLTVAHRGLHDLPGQSGVPENSLAAFREAVRAGIAIETDIHLTADGEVVVFHDDTLDRMCGVSGSPETMTLAELRALRLGGTDEVIPTFRELLDLADGKVPLLIEFKCVSRAQAAALCGKAAPMLDGYAGTYWVQSFSPFMVGWYRRHRPGVCRGQLSASFRGRPLPYRIAGCLLFNAVGRPDFVSYDHRDASHPCRRLCTALGAHPVCWTLHSQAELDAARDRAHFRTFIFEGFVPSDK